MASEGRAFSGILGFRPRRCPTRVAPPLLETRANRRAGIDRRIERTADIFLFSLTMSIPTDPCGLDSVVHLRYFDLSATRYVH